MVRVFLDLSDAVHIGTETMQAGELFDEDVEDRGKRLRGAFGMLCEDGLDKIEEQLDTHGLNARRQGGVVKDLRVDMNDTDQLSRRELLTDVVDKIGKHADGEGTLRLV